jgi:hypothetical protein
MKDRKSKLLRDVLTELNRPRFQTKADRDLLALVTDWPFNIREPVFCWLWGNHAWTVRRGRGSPRSCVRMVSSGIPVSPPNGN